MYMYICNICIYIGYIYIYYRYTYTYITYIYIYKPAAYSGESNTNERHARAAHTCSA